MPRFPSTSFLRLAAISLALSTVPAVAQQQNNAGIGTVKRFYNASVQTRPNFDALITGVAYINGTVYTCSGSPGGTAPFGPLCYVFNNGKKTGQFTVPLAPASGSYDMDTDGKIIFNASDNGILVYDTKGGTTNLTVQAKNGAQKVTKNPITSAVTNPHAVAYDPNGNKGNGSLFVAAQAGGPIVEIDLTGKTLNTFQNQGWRGGGLTCDPRTGNLWVMTGTAVWDIIELDRKNQLKPTGNKFLQGNPATQWQLRCCGGICGIPGGDKHSYASDFDIALVNRQPGDDYVFIHRVHLSKNLIGYDEAQLVGAINQTTGLTTGTLGALGTAKTGDTLNWQFIPGKKGKKGDPVIATVSVGPDAALDGVNFGGLLLPEWRALSPFSVPSSPFIVFWPPTVVGGAVNTVKIPPKLLRCFELIRLQGIVIDVPSLDLLATNEVWVDSSNEKDCSIIVEAVGVNSFNNVTTSGFWRVIHKGGPPIKEITLDWMACNDIRQTQIYFDCDNPTMADFFNAGNSTTVTCTGTYRNGSDKAVGLIYDSKNFPVNTCAAPGSNTGWIGRNGFNNGNGTNLKTLTFRFAPAKFFGTPIKPKVFEWDTDTDRGRGVNGASMEGLVVKITLQTGKVLMGQLRADTTSSVSRSVVGF